MKPIHLKLHTCKSILTLLIILLIGQTSLHAQNLRKPSLFIPGKLKATTATISTTPLSGTLTPEDLVQNLLGPGVSFSNVDFTGADPAAGTFTNGLQAGLDFNQGIILSSGSCASAAGPNNSTAMSVDNDEPGDNDLEAISGFDTFDATVLEFDFVPVSDSISFYFIFGSEEYPEFVNSSYNDVFAFFLNGTNIANVPGTSDPIDINSVNATQNASWYISNDSAVHNIQADGYLVKILMEGQVVPNETNHIKLAIADASDGVYDSWVFLQGGSFSTNNPPDAELFPIGVQTIGIGDTIIHTVGFDSPESGQTTNVVVNSGGLPGFSYTVTPGNVASVSYQFIGRTDNLGLHTVQLVATDNGTPVASTTETLMFRVIHDSLNLRNINIIDGDSCYDATQIITTGGNGTTFIVNDGTKAILIAGKRILMFPGTYVLPGGDMQASITGNNNYCTPPAIFPSQAMPAGLPETTTLSAGGLFTIYPNPATGMTFIKSTPLNPEENFITEIYNGQGRLIKVYSESHASIKSVDLSGYPAGIYFIKLTTRDKTEMARIIRL